MRAMTSSTVSLKRTTCSTGPKISSPSCSMRSSSKATGRIWRGMASATGASAMSLASRLRRSMWRLMLAWASSSMTGPTSVARSAGRPTCSSRSAPRSISMTPSAMLSCTHSRRSAEQRWPAERKALCTTASMTCSGSAVESTTIAFRPPVSAISGRGEFGFLANALLMIWATAVEPVKQTPAVWAWATRPAPTVSPGPCSRASASAGTPASCSSSTIFSATYGVCSAGLAATVLPATSAATTWPAKMASGKFQGLMQTNTPRPCISAGSASAWSA
mmetsp:Transcript_28791/g.67986  ORF Transcript_28791/g.67986 Transcript_28791/m.67986 type:complete len:276 (+) Transcript_28791:332-1159(+)